MATEGYQAGVEANDVELSYAKESVWGEKPATAFQAIRFTGGDQFAGSKTRQRPNEVRTDAQASAAITTQEQAAAGVSFALSYGTYDDILAGLLMGEWTTPLAITATTITADNATAQFQGDAGAFDDVTVGQWVKVAGFDTAAANGFFRVTAKAGDGSTITVDPAPADDANLGGDSISLTGSHLHNGTVFQSFHFQKKLASNLFLIYPGTYLATGSLNAALGQFMNGQVGGAAKEETSATSNQSTGAVLAAPTGRVHDTVAGLQQITMDGAAVGAVIEAINVSINKEGAQAQYGLGSAAAQGMLKGTFTLTGSIRTYFKDFTLYAKYKAETDHVVAYRTSDSAGNAYIITVPAATIMNPNITAGGPGQAVMAEFQLEGNPHPTLGWTFQIDKFPAA
ncbi:MAG: hypothetical protein LDL44_00655 [Caenispirillum sp.]|nr:hypothetical protein [Caenispirillum sp.]